ncbi:aminotransferase-like domain-containing protein [Kribbella sp. NPDC002412]
MNDSTTSVGALVGELRRTVAGLRPGDRLPASRELMARHEVGPGTVSRAIARLVAEGLVVARPGSGTYVAPRRQAAKPADLGWQSLALADRTIDTRSVADDLGVPVEGAVMLDGGYLHRSLQPGKAMTAALVRAARRPDAWDRAPISGLAPLRSLFAAAVDAAPEDVLITAGGQNALSIAFRALAAPGSPVLVESPTYHGALAAARSAGLRPVPVPVDADGVRPDLLAEAFEQTGSRVFYCQPAHHNPTGAELTAERRVQVLDVARAANAFVIEDDASRLLGHGTGVPRPLLTDDAQGTVVYLTSLTKLTAPSFRIGALIARGPVAERLRASRHVDDFFVARPLQEAAVELLGSSGWDRHLRSLAPELRRRCRVLATALGELLPEWTVDRLPTGGLHLWVRLPSADDELRLQAEAPARSVVVGAGARHFAAEPPGAYLRLNFAAAASDAELVESVHRLAA